MDMMLHEFLLSGADASRLAVIDRGRRFSHGDLRSAVRRACAALQGRGVGPGDRVQILGEAGFETLACLLGVLMAGAQYVPISASYPSDMLAGLRTRVPFALCVHDGSAAARAKLPGAGAHVSASDLVAEGGAPVAPPLTPDMPAYTIFTSGTTGRPKGIEMTHRAALTYLRGIHALALTGPEDRIVSVSPLQFDLSLIDLALSLGAGGAVAFFSRAQLHMVVRFLEQTRRIGATALSGAPSIWTIVAEAGALEQARHLRTIFAAGEAFAPRTYEALRRSHPDATFVNVYGQSESIACMAHVARFGEMGGEIPVGRPVQGFEVQLVDRESGAPVAGAGQGELMVSGPGLFTGYLDAPEVTARVIHSDAGGRRWFRSGDLLRRDADGVYTYLRRLDAQVQVNGHRVEPAEIALRLKAVEGVGNAHVMQDEDGLIACIESTTAGIEGAVRKGLADLPHYMRPRRIRVLARFPLTPAGKLDTRALQEEVRDVVV